VEIKLRGQVSLLDQYSPEREIFMKRFTWLFIVSLILGGAAYAQDHPKVEVTGYYSYFRFNPENSGTLNSHSLNGGGGEISLYFSRMIGVKAEFAGYQGNKVTFTSGSVSASVTANLFTYNVGPVIKLRSGHFEPFGEVLFGGAIPVSTATCVRHLQVASSTIQATMHSTS
jgi:hypothetical protein